MKTTFWATSIAIIIGTIPIVSNFLLRTHDELEMLKQLCAFYVGFTMFLLSVVYEQKSAETGLVNALLKIERDSPV